jgi:hypothetical protein
MNLNCILYSIHPKSDLYLGLLKRHNTYRQILILEIYQRLGRLSAILVPFIMVGFIVYLMLKKK